jgi:ZIP family zinc transporter
VRLSVVAAVVFVIVVLAAGVTAFLLGRSGGAEGEASVRTVALRPGEIDLVIVNHSSETKRLAQVIVNDAYVNFHAGARVVRPAQRTHVTIPYPWIAGESYEVEILTSSGAAIDYEIEDADAA